MECLDFVCSEAARVILTCASSLSVVSSVLIITVILRSTTALGSTYHRIMVSICIGDILSSVGTAFNTILMPASTSDVYRFIGARGTVGTCEAQGFVVQAGSNLAFTSSLHLTLYYLLTICFNVKDRVMVKFIEPFFCISSTFFMIYAPILYLKQGLFNPVPFSNWCNIGDFPYGCNKDEEVPCIRGRMEGNDFLNLPFESKGSIMTWIVYSGLMVQVISLIAIVYHVYRINNSKQMPDGSSVENSSKVVISTPKDQAGTSRFDTETKLFMRQACMYFMASVATFGLTPVITQLTGTPWLTILGLILKPSQGTYNAIIFIHHKTHNLMKYSSDDFTLFEAIYIAITKPSSVPEVVIDLEAMEESSIELARMTRKGIINRPTWFFTNPVGNEAVRRQGGMPEEVSQEPESMVSSRLVSIEPSRTSGAKCNPELVTHGERGRKLFTSKNSSLSSRGGLLSFFSQSLDGFDDSNAASPSDDVDLSHSSRGISSVQSRGNVSSHLSQNLDSFDNNAASPSDNVDLSHSSRCISSMQSRGDVSSYPSQQSLNRFQNVEEDHVKGLNSSGGHFSFFAGELSSKGSRHSGGRANL